MPGGGVGQLHPANHDAHWFETVASLTVGLGFFALWFWLLPGWLRLRSTAVHAQPWRWIAAIPSILGFAVALRCVWDFGHTGRGTPAPMAPPRKLVVVGFYRYVRNPMYAGFFAGWIGLWTMFGWLNWPAISVAGLVMVGVMLFVRLYEEPTLHRLFGSDYDEYCRNVPRWIPRGRPWRS